MVLALCEEWWVLTTVKTSFPFSQQIPSEVLKQCAKGIQTGDLGASPQFPSPDTLERKLGNCIGVWWSRSRTTLTLTPSPLLFNRPHPQIHSNLLYLPWIRLDFWSRILTVFLVFLVRLIMGISAYLDLWDVAFLEKIYMHIKPWDREPSFSSSWPLNREPLLKLTNWYGKGGVRHNLSLEPQVLEVLCVPSFLFSWSTEVQSFLIWVLRDADSKLNKATILMTHRGQRLLQVENCKCALLPWLASMRHMTA